MRWLAAALASLAAVLLALVMCTAVAEALENGKFGWSAEPAAGRQPLLVIWLREADEIPAPELAKYRSYYEETVFGKAAPGFTGNRLSVIAYFQEVSAGKFTFERAGLVGPLTHACHWTGNVAASNGHGKMCTDVYSVNEALGPGGAAGVRVLYQGSL
jgi:hypothetical protein